MPPEVTAGEATARVKKNKNPRSDHYTGRVHAGTLRPVRTGMTAWIPGLAPRKSMQTSSIMCPLHTDAREASMHVLSSVSDPCARIHGAALMMDAISCSMVRSGALNPTNAQSLLNHTRAGRFTAGGEPLGFAVWDPWLGKKRIKDSLFIAAHAAASRPPERYAMPRPSHRRCP